MQDLQNSIDSAINDELGKGQLDLQACSKRWAEFSLDTYTGDLLSKALEISKAIAGFNYELIKPGHES